MKYSFSLSFYLLVTNRLSGLASRKLNSRLKDGKEDPNRIDERRGVSNVTRPQGELCLLYTSPSPRD